DVSIVSHGHGGMVDSLIEKLLQYPEIDTVILTQNIPEPEPTISSNNPRVKLIQNKSRQGYGKNHNNAASEASSPFFCVLNPDVEFGSNPFSALLSSLRKTRSSLIAPMVVNHNGILEDSVRHFPGAVSLIKKFVGVDVGEYEFDSRSNVFSPDWVAGMFMLFDVEAFREVGGFDEAYFLYYEDVDICARIWKNGMKVAFDPGVSVIHTAHRSSRRDLRFMVWHASSMARYFAKHWGRLPRIS
ncbi:glycosyltransferase family 2 protein, partial [Ketobacter sp.]